MDITVFLGAPGSGKGTQAKRLSQNHGFRHFSTGDMLRSAIQAGSDVGLRAKSFIDRGELVPDNVMIELIEGALSKLDSKAKIVLDGFPRTVPQAEALDKNTSTTVTRALFFKVPENVLVERLTGRRICEKCGESFHVSFMPSKVKETCDRCSGRLVQRVDDGESVVRRRLEVFNQQNAGLLAYYNDKDKLRELDGDLQVEALQSQLLALLH